MYEKANLDIGTISKLKLIRLSFCYTIYFTRSNIRCIYCIFMRMVNVIKENIL